MFEFEDVKVCYGGCLLYTSLYQGQELGRVNQEFTSVSQLKDVESINLYEDVYKRQAWDWAMH